MTDSEIIKGLERCKNGLCVGCHFGAVAADCLTIMTTNVLDLISHQKAEIERLKEKNESLETLVLSYGDYVTKTRAEAIKEFAERLKENKIDIDVSFDYGKTIYTEAVPVIELNNLVKEMVGDNNETD